MKTLKYIIFLLTLALTGLSLTGCNSEDNLNTDPYGNDISVLSFGPCPVLRGGTLHFLGSNLDQIAEIDLPGADPITQYEVVKAGQESEITIQVPAEKCDTGIVVLKTRKGGVIRTITPVTYREDIVVKDFYVGSDKSSKTGSVGDVVTIEGDYLNLFHGVIFTDRDTIPESQFTEHSRYMIRVIIPKEAKTGVLKLTDLAEAPTEYETKEVLNVNLPEAKGIDNTHPKAGQNITVTGSSLEQIVAVKFQGATIEGVTAAGDGRSLTVAVPVKATDGEVTLVTASGVEIPAGTITTVVPTDLSYAPTSVKNGSTITVTGKDLDLVTTMQFSDGANGIDVDAVYKDGKVSAVVPEKAQAGELKLKLANGKTVSLDYKLVEPTVTKFSPAVVTAGNKIAIIGRDLDLVASVTFPGDSPLQGEDMKASEGGSAITVGVPAAAYGTGCTLNLKNGTTVEVKAGLTVHAATMPAVNGAANGVVGEYVTITGKNFNNIESLYIGATKVTKFKDKTNRSLTFQVPATLASGSYTFIAVQPDGTKVELGTFIVKSKEADLAEYARYEDQSSLVSWPFNFDWSSGTGKMRIFKADLKKLGVKEGSQLIIYKEAGQAGQVQINNANWGAVVTVADRDGTSTKIVQVFDAAMMDAINNVSDGWSDTAFILQGDLKGVTKMAIMP